MPRCRAVCAGHTVHRRLAKAISPVESKGLKVNGKATVSRHSSQLKSPHQLPYSLARVAEGARVTVVLPMHLVNREIVKHLVSLALCCCETFGLCLCLQGDRESTIEVSQSYAYIAP